MENNNNSKLKSQSKYMMGLFSFVGVFLILTIVLTNFDLRGTHSAAVLDDSSLGGGGSSSSNDETSTTSTCASLGLLSSCPANANCNRAAVAGDGTQCYTFDSCKSGYTGNASGCTAVTCTTNGGESKTTCQTNANRECGTNNWTGCTNAIHDEENTISCFSYKCNDNCIFGAITQNSAGGIFASVSATGNKTASECCASKGWDYRGGKCYTKGTLIVGGKEYNWTNSLDGQCAPGYKYDESLKLCVEELCDCGDGGCSDAQITVTSGGGTTYTPGDTPTDTPTDTPSTNCYSCSTSSGDKYTNATSPSNAATATGGSNCSIVSDSYCQSQSSTNCYECVVNDKKQHTMATSESEAKTKTGGSSCTIVTTDKCNTSVNPQTGTLAIIVAWIVGVATLSYAGWYFVKSKTLNK